MKIIEPGFEILHRTDADDVLRHLETAARVCYKSEDKTSEGSAEKLIKRIVGMGHESVLEHGIVSAKIICDRGITHEIVRHRICSFSQESTRYANYSKDKFGKEITLIRPFFWDINSAKYQLWVEACEAAERVYLGLIETGATAQEARSVLPNSLKTEIIVTTNIREWRHILDLRTAGAAHPDMRNLMKPLLRELKEKYPIFFMERIKYGISTR